MRCSILTSAILLLEKVKLEPKITDLLYLLII